MPAGEREAIEQEDEIFGFMRQSHISARNVKRLRILAESQSPRVADPAQKRPELLDRMDESGLSEAHQWQ